MDNISKHIKKGDINVMKKTEKSGTNNSKKNYQLYLQTGNSKTKQKVKKNNPNKKEIGIIRDNKHNKHNKHKDPTIRIIKQGDKNKSKNKFTRKKPSKIKDINEIEKAINKIEHTKISKREPPQRSNQKSLKRSNKRANKKSNKRSGQKKKIRKISISNKKPVKEDIKNIENKIADIRNKKPEDIKRELEKEGIKISGKSNRLLKDIYFYSKVCNININHEK